jgi:hypothetical protein
MVKTLTMWLKNTDNMVKNADNMVKKMLTLSGP